MLQDNAPRQHAHTQHTRTEASLSIERCKTRTEEQADRQGSTALAPPSIIGQSEAGMSARLSSRAFAASVPKQEVRATGLTSSLGHGSQCSNSRGRSHLVDINERG